MDPLDFTRDQLPFNLWFDAASMHWDQFGFEEAYDWHQLLTQA